MSKDLDALLGLRPAVRTPRQLRAVQDLWKFYCATLAEDKLDGSPFDFEVHDALFALAERRAESPSTATSGGSC